MELVLETYLLSIDFRWIAGGDVIVLLGNLGHSAVNFNLKEHDPSLPNLDIVISDVNSSKQASMSLNSQNIPLNPNEAVVARGSLSRSSRSYRR